MTTFQVVRVEGASFDRDDFCIGRGTRSEPLFTVEAPYPAAVDLKAVRARVEAMGIRLEGGFANYEPSVASFRVVGGGHVAIDVAEED